jgi:hypothetical protein
VCTSGLKISAGAPFFVFVTGSITPRTNSPEIRYQPSMLSVPSAASTVAPDRQAPNSGKQPPNRKVPRKLWFFVALSAFAGAAAVGRFGRAPISADVRSGSPGYRATSTGKDQHWAKKALTVYVDDSVKQLGPSADEAVMQAFGTWVGSDQRLPDLSFDTVKGSAIPKNDGKSTVSFGRITAPGHEKDVAITITYSNDKTGEIIEADVILNALYPMGLLTAKGHGAGEGDKDDKDDNKSQHRATDESSDCRNRYDVQNVITHEAGHFFGLGEDMTERDATMFLSINQCETHKRFLAVTDTTAITTLYAKSEDPEEAKAGPRACSFGGVPQTGGAFWLSGAIFGLSLLRRRRAR